MFESTQMAEEFLLIPRERYERLMTKIKTTKDASEDKEPTQEPDVQKETAVEATVEDKSEKIHLEANREPKSVKTKPPLEKDTTHEDPHKRKKRKTPKHPMKTPKPTTPQTPPGSPRSPVLKKRWMKF